MRTTSVQLIYLFVYCVRNVVHRTAKKMNVLNFYHTLLSFFNHDCVLPSSKSRVTYLTTNDLVCRQVRICGKQAN
jgi:hypothetical protein